MSAEMVTALSGVGVSVVTAAGSVWVARSGRRTRQQERRDDFTAIKTALNEQIGELKKDASVQKAEIADQRRRIGEQDEVLAWLWTWTRSLVGFVRGLGHEPPAAPQPVPEPARRYLHTDV